MSVDTPEIRDHLQSRIREAFSKASLEVEEVQYLTGAANSASNLKILTRNHGTFSIKGVTRIADRGTANEILAYAICEALGMRGSGRARLVQVETELLPFKHADAVLIEWMEGQPQPLRSGWDSVMDHSVEFLRQYGAWAVVAAFIGVRDRHDGNLVWEPNNLCLAHIDFEDGFAETIDVRSGEMEAILKEQIQYAPRVGLNPSKWRSDSNDYLGAAFAEGIDKGHALVLQNLETLEGLMSLDGISPDFRAKAAAWARLPAPEKVSRVQALL